MSDTQYICFAVMVLGFMGLLAYIFRLIVLMNIAAFNAMATKDPEEDDL